MSNPKVLHPIKVGGKPVKPGTELDPAKVGEDRLARLVAKGRVEAAPVNRAEPEAGRPALSGAGTGGKK